MGELRLLLVLALLATVASCAQLMALTDRGARGVSRQGGRARGAALGADRLRRAMRKLLESEKAALAYLAFIGALVVLALVLPERGPQ